MAEIIEIGLKKNTLPVKVWGVEFELQQGEKFRREYLKQVISIKAGEKKIEEEINKAVEDEDLKRIEKANDKLFKLFKSFTDTVLGEGAFDKLYAVRDDADEIVSAVSELIELATKIQVQSKGNSYITGKKG